MAEQVSDIQRQENLDFDKAFLKTQKLWADEFKMTGYPGFYREKIPVIVKKIIKKSIMASLRNRCVSEYCHLQLISCLFICPQIRKFITIFSDCIIPCLS